MHWNNGCGERMFPPVTAILHPNKKGRSPAPSELQAIEARLIAYLIALSVMAVV
jgi:hypothetical protein